MSHYSVAVFHREDQDVDELLAPYSENIQVAPYIRYTREQAIQHCKDCWRQDFLEGKSDEDLWQAVAEDYDNRTDEAGNIYSTYNPHSKWDWYCTGGRWGGELKIKEEARAKYGGCDEADEARVGDIDFSGNPEEYARALRFWDIVVDGKPKTKEEEEAGDFFSIYNEKYYRDYYGDRETYARHVSQWATFAVVTPNGLWHEKGEMGWFGMSSDTPDDAKDWNEHYRERFIDKADPDWILTVVDCHI